MTLLRCTRCDDNGLVRCPVCNKEEEEEEDEDEGVSLRSSMESNRGWEEKGRRNEDGMRYEEGRVNNKSSRCEDERRTDERRPSKDSVSRAPKGILKKSHQATDGREPRAKTQLHTEGSSGIGSTSDNEDHVAEKLVLKVNQSARNHIRVISKTTLSSNVNNRNANNNNSKSYYRSSNINNNNNNNNNNNSGKSDYSNNNNDDDDSNNIIINTNERNNNSNSNRTLNWDSSCHEDLLDSEA